MSDDKPPGWLPNGKFNVRHAGVHFFAQRQIHPDDPDVQELIRQTYPDLPAHVYPLIHESIRELWRFVEWGEFPDGTKDGD